MRSKPLRLSHAVVLACLASFALGCASLQHHKDTGAFIGQPLHTGEARAAQRLAGELASDATMATYAEKHGKPDYFYIESRQKLYFFYLQRDRAAKFERVLLEDSQVTELGRIPGSLLKRLPETVRAQLQRQRQVGQRRAQAQAKRAKVRAAHAPRRASSPASAAPGGTYFGGFEVDSIVARMREPMTAADSGVSGWRASKRTDGATAYTAKRGSARYEVAHQRVALTVKMSSKRTKLPGLARHEILRLNSAIFGAKAKAVTRTVMGMAERAAADRSGATAFAKRVQGRTIRIGRRTDAGVFAYSVHP
ncbi:MAG: hypothetical protein AAF430_04225 [Myxococcota bacterium]